MGTFPRLQTLLGFDQGSYNSTFALVDLVGMFTPGRRTAALL